MLNITIDNELAAKLRDTEQAATVRDADGRLLGVFTCMPPGVAATYQHALDTIDPDELKRRANDSRPGHTTQQVLERLRQMEREECASP